MNAKNYLIASKRDEILNEKLTDGFGSRYVNARDFILNKYPNGFIDPGAEIHPTVKMGKGCIIMPNVIIKKGVILGDNVVILGNNFLKTKAIIKKESIIGDNCQIKGAEIGEYAIIGKNNDIYGVKIGHKVTIGNSCRIYGDVIGDRTKIADQVYMDAFGYIANDVTIGNRNYIGEAVRIKNDVKLESACVILKDSIIKSGANLNNVFLKKEVEVGANSKITNTLLETGSKIKSNQKIDDNKNITDKANFH